MRKIPTVTAAAAMLSAAALMPAPGEAMTIAAPRPVGAMQRQKPAGVQSAAYVCRWTTWGRRCWWRPGWGYWGRRRPYWGWRHDWW